MTEIRIRRRRTPANCLQGQARPPSAPKLKTKDSLPFLDTDSHRINLPHPPHEWRVNSGGQALSFNPPRGWRASPPKRAADKPAFDKSSDSACAFAEASNFACAFAKATADKCAMPDKSAGKFWFRRSVFGGVGKEKRQDAGQALRFHLGQANQIARLRPGSDSSI